ncbi:hypothetical protein ACIA37_04610 [Lactobacillus delbrueckii subsp. bulgaricus]|uniref:hypothetical protein n=1 Tax=Lactobacillus delbrueckii TaxID=1584 RepID=UPI0037C528A1
MPDGEDVYVDFFYTDEDLDGNDDAPTIADFDQKVAEEYPMFLRTRMPARLLLKILKNSKKAAGSKPSLKQCIPCAQIA